MTNGERKRSWRVHGLSSALKGKKKLGSSKTLQEDRGGKGGGRIRNGQPEDQDLKVH